MRKKKKMISGYYFDGKDLWIIYHDESGKESMKKDNS